jgi:hypothetical protein
MWLQLPVPSHALAHWTVVRFDLVAMLHPLPALRFVALRGFQVCSPSEGDSGFFAC